jgi:nitrate reductase NapAB chaperone NapD
MEEIKFQLSDDQVELFTNVGNVFALSEIDADEAIHQFATAVSNNTRDDLGNLVINIDWYVWEAGSEVIKSAYAKKKNVSLDSDTVKSMWKRFTRRLEENFGITKPAKPTTTGQKKAEQRSKAQVEMDKLKEKSIQELQAEIAMLTTKATKENLKQAGKLASAIEAKNKDALKDRMEAIKELQGQVIKATKSCLDEDLLYQVLDTLDAYNPQESES